MAKFCTKCGKKLMDGEVCDCMKAAAAPNPQDETVVLNAAAQKAEKPAPKVDPVEQNYERRAQEQSYQSAPQNQNYQSAPQNYQSAPQNYQNAPQGQYQNAPQGQYQNAPQGQYQNAPQGQWQNGPQGQYQNGPQGQWQNGPQGQYQNGPQGQWQNGPQNQWQNGPQNQWQNGPQAQWFNDQKDKFVSNAKGLLAQLSPLVKQPDTTLRSLAKSNNSMISLQMIGLQAVMTILMVLVLGWKFRLPSEVKEMMGSYASRYSFPMFTTILVSVLLIFGIAYLRAFMMKAFSGKMNPAPTLNQTLLISGVCSLIGFFMTAVYTVLIMIFFPSMKKIMNIQMNGGYRDMESLGMTMLIMMVLMAVAAVIFMTATSIFEFKAYLCVVTGDENKKVYRFMWAKIVTDVLSVIISCLVLNSAFEKVFSVLGRL